MNEEGAIQYYNKHLIADVFGQWVSWWLVASKQSSDNNNLSTKHFALRQMDNFIYKLKLRVYSRNKRLYGLSLGCVMADLLYKRKGMRGFAKFVAMKLAKPTKGEQSMNIRHAKMYMLFQRLKKKVMLRMKFLEARKVQLREHSGDNAEPSKWRLLAKKVMDKLLILTSFQTKQRLLLQQSYRFRTNMMKRNYLGLWRRRHNARMAEMQFEQSYIDIHVKRKMLLNEFKALRINAMDSEKQRRTVKACVQHALRTLAHRALHRLYHTTITIHKVFTSKHTSKRLDEYSRHKAMRRVIVALLRRLKKRLVITLPLLSKVTLHTIHMWGFRRKSHAVLQWICQYKRKKLEQRRHKISTFHYHQRLTLSALTQLHCSMLRTITQKQHKYNAEYYRYKKCAHLGLTHLMQYCLLQKRYAIQNYRSVLFWKYYRTSKALYRFKLHRTRRQRKRKMLLNAQLDYENRIKREACAEFIRVAYASGENYVKVNKVDGSGNTHGTTTYSRSEHVKNVTIVKRIFATWKECVHSSRAIRQQECNTAWYKTGNVLNTNPPTIQIHTTINTATNPTNGAYTGSSSASLNTAPTAVLSRAPPRSQLPQPLPLPVPLRDSKLDMRYLPSHANSVGATTTTNNSTSTSSKDSSHYDYLTIGTSLPRPPYPASATLYNYQYNNSKMHSTGTNTVATVGDPHYSRATPRTASSNVYSILNDTIHVSSDVYPSGASSMYMNDHYNHNNQYSAITPSESRIDEDPYFAAQLAQFVQMVEATDLASCSPERKEWLREAALIFKQQLM